METITISDGIMFFAVLIAPLLAVQAQKFIERSHRKEEIKKTLERQAIEEINKTVKNISCVLAEILIPHLLVEKKHITSGGLNSMKMLEHQKMIMEGLTNFRFTIEAHQIVVLKFDHLGVL